MKVQQRKLERKERDRRRGVSFPRARFTWLVRKRGRRGVAGLSQLSSLGRPSRGLGRGEALQKNDAFPVPLYDTSFRFGVPNSFLPRSNVHSPLETMGNSFFGGNLVSPAWHEIAY